MNEDGWTDEEGERDWKIPFLEVLSCVSFFPLRFLLTIMNPTLAHTRTSEIRSKTRMNGAGLTRYSKQSCRGVQSVFSILVHRAGFEFFVFLVLRFRSLFLRVSLSTRSFRITDPSTPSSLSLFPSGGRASDAAMRLKQGMITS